MAAGAEFSLSYLTVLGTPPEEQVEVAARSGYDYLGVRFNAVAEGEVAFPFLSDPGLVRRFTTRLADTGMAVLDAEQVRLGPGDDPAAYAGFLEVARTVGARHVVAQVPDPDRGRAAEHLAHLCDLAAPLDLTVEVEFIPWTATNDLAAAAEIVIRAGRPNGGIVVDALHFHRSGSTVAQLVALAPGLFRFAQLCDAPLEAPTDREGLIRAARTERMLLGEGGLDLRSLVAGLPAVPYALEVPNDALRRRLGTERFAVQVLDSARRWLEEDGSPPGVTRAPDGGRRPSGPG
jgi:sugar phosphate isomerase/epimerase